MQRIPAISLLVFAFALLVASPVFAERRAHHPWFGKSKEASSPAPEAGLSPVGDAASPPLVLGNDLSKVDKGRLVASRALQYKGTRYRYGGTTKSGMDCSGLVDRVWADLKMKKIPRVSSALYTSGKPVHLAELQPGDLVFFKNTYKHGISHVGVYAGNNKFVHAAGHSRGVTITRLSDPYYQLHYAGARRLY